MGSKVQIDVGILTSGRLDLLEKTINHAAASCEKAGVAYRILVLDNGTPQDVLQSGGSVFFNPNISKRERVNNNVGFPRGANLLISMGNAPLFLFISEDVFLSEDAVTALVKRMTEDSTIGICGLKLVFPYDSIDGDRPAGKVQHVGHAVSINSHIVHPLIGWSSDNPKTKQSRECFSVTGAVFMVRTNVFKAAGKFNEEYGTGTYEDVELCVKIRKLGFKVFIDTDAVAEHVVGASMEVQKQGFPINKNRLVFLSNYQTDLVWDDWTYF